MTFFKVWYDDNHFYVCPTDTEQEAIEWFENTVLFFKQILTWTNHQDGKSCKLPGGASWIIPGQSHELLYQLLSDPIVAITRIEGPFELVLQDKSLHSTY